MPAIYTNMPFTVEARLNDPDNFPNNFLSYTWSIATQPAGATLVFLNTNSVTPTVIADTPGNYSIVLTAFDGAVSVAANYNFTVSPAFATTAFLQGSCASSGSGLATTVRVVNANASSIVSQSDANAKAATNASQSLTAVLNCCPATIRLTLPPDAPAGASYSVLALPTDTNPSQDFASAVLPPGRGAYFIVGSGVSAGATVELYSYFPSIPLNTPLQLLVSVTEISPFNQVIEPANFDLALAPAPLNGNLAGATVSKVQKKTVGYAPTSGLPTANRSLGYRLNLPAPAATRAVLTLANEIPGHGPWALDASGWDWVAGYGAANALGVFLLTGGTLASPTSETLLLAMNPNNSEPALLNAYYNFFGFSQLPYQGSLYAPLYNDRRSYASIPHTGFINVTPSALTSWARALVNYISANNPAAPWNVYLRAGIYNNGVYSWTANSVALNLERNPSGTVSIASLTGAGSILGAANGVLSITAAALNTPNSFFATIRGSPTLLLDLYRFSTGYPTGVQVGVYTVNNWPANPTGGTRVFAILPNAPAGRGYDVTNLLSNSTLLSLLISNGSLALAFYLETSANAPIANSFPLAVSNLTNYAPSSPMYSINSIAAVGNLPAGTNNVLFIANAGAKILLSSANG
jgi:hypothetical protein